MKIHSIGLVYQKTNNQRITISNYNGNYNINPLIASNQVDTVSFGRVAKNAEKMRSLFKYGVIDMNTGQYLIDPEWFKELLQKGVFERSIQSIVRTIKPVEDRLHEVEAELFKKIEQYAKNNPTLKLDEVIKKLAPQAQERLLELQRPIFNELKRISIRMPEEQKKAFDNLMKTTEKQLENRPVVYKFSKKEFKYKLERIAGDIKRKGILEEINAIKKLSGMADKLPYIPSGRNFLRQKPEFNPKKSLNQANLIRQMDNYLARSSLKNNKALRDLFDSAKKHVFNIPTVVPFQRKTFIHELQSITDSMKDDKLGRDMIKIACKLPTAQKEFSAFIMKSSRYSSSKIGHDLLYGSVGAVDHLVAFSKGGADTLENYGYTSNAKNSERGNMVMSKWLKHNPQTYEGSQKSVDRLIELFHLGVLDKEEMNPMYIVNFSKRMKKLSPSDKPLILNLGNFEKEIHKE